MTVNATSDDRELALAPLDEKVDHVRGSPAGRLIIGYGDYECPYSRQAFHAIEQVEQQLGGDMPFAFRHFPLTGIHPHALAAASAADAAARQGRFWDMHELLFHRQKEDRGKAFGSYGAIAAAGGAVGLLLGGALTEYLSWRWTLYVNLLFAGVAFTGGALLLKRQSSRVQPRLDVPGALLVSSAVLIHCPVLASARSWVICAATIMVDGCTGVRSASIWRTQSQALPRCPSVASMVDE